MKSATFFCLMALGAVTIAGASGDVPLEMLARNQVLCFSDQFHVCQTVVQQFLVEFDVPMLERLTEISNLDRLCNQLNDTNHCMSNIRPECKAPGIQWAFHLYLDIVGYICSTEGRDVLLAGTQCFENLEEANTIEFCFANFEQSSNDQNPCGQLDQLGSCVEDSVRNVCSNEEGDFAETLTSRYLAHVKSAISCDVITKARRAGDLRMLFHL